MSAPLKNLLNPLDTEEQGALSSPPNADARTEDAASSTFIDNETDLAESSADETTREAIENEIASATPQKEIPEEGVSDQDISIIAEILGKDVVTVGRTIRLAIHKGRTKRKWSEFTKEEHGVDGSSTTRVLQNWVKLEKWSLVVEYMNKDGTNKTVMAHFPTREKLRKVTRRSPAKS